MLNVYWRKIVDHIIEQMQQHHNDIKRQLIGKCKVRVNAFKDGNIRRYVAGNQTYEYTADELNDMTAALIRCG